MQELLGSGAYAAAVAVCPPYRESLTLGPVVDAVRGVRERVVGLRLTALAGALRPLFPEWAGDLPPAPEPLGDARAARGRLFRALAELIQAIGLDLLVVEDAHWADESTLELLLFLAARRPPRPPSLVVTYRPEAVPDGSLLRRLSSRSSAGAAPTRLTVRPLDLAGTTELVSSMLGGEPVSERFAGLLQEHTDGVPLAVEESVRLLADRADLLRQDGQWVRRSLAELQVPPTVRDATLERYQRLSAAAQCILAAAAVLAAPAREVVLRAVAGQAQEQAWDGVQEALGSGLLREDAEGRLGIRHALMSRAIYEAVPGRERQRLHRSAGRVLQGADPPPVVRLARHFREAGEVGGWAEYAEQAADRAACSGDHVTAVTLLNDLLALREVPQAVRARLARKVGLAAQMMRMADEDRASQAVSGLRTGMAAPEPEALEITVPAGSQTTVDLGVANPGGADLAWRA